MGRAPQSAQSSNSHETSPCLCGQGRAIPWHSGETGKKHQEIRSPSYETSFYESPFCGSMFQICVNPLSNHGFGAVFNIRMGLQEAGWKLMEIHHGPNVEKYRAFSFTTIQNVVLRTTTESKITRGQKLTVVLPPWRQRSCHALIACIYLPVDVYQLVGLWFFHIPSENQTWLTGKPIFSRFQWGSLVKWWILPSLTTGG